MKTYDVEIQRAVSLIFTVEADDVEEAEQLALEEAYSTSFDRAPCPEYKVLETVTCPVQASTLND